MSVTGDIRTNGSESTLTAQVWSNVVFSCRALNIAGLSRTTQSCSVTAIDVDTRMLSGLLSMFFL